jgi:hypothetical protein
MPTFEITLADGRRVDVDAPNAKAAAEGGAQWAKANPVTGRPAADRDAARRLKSTPDQLRAVSKGATFGFADELDAAGAALETGVSNLFKRATGQKPAYGMKDAYGAVMAANAKADNLFAEKNPVQNVVLQIGGGLIGPGVASGAKFIGAGRSLLGTTARAAGVGLATGAVAGFGTSDGGLAERGRGAARGATAGAIVGGALPSVGRLAQTGGRAINGALGQPFGGANQGAIARLREALKADGLDEAQLRTAIQQWTQSGVTPEFLNIAGENTRALIRTAGSQGPARQATQKYRNTTVASIPNRAIERANALTPGETRRPAQFVADTVTQRRTDANVRYAGPNSTPVEINGEMARAMRGNTGRAAIAEARRVAEINGDTAVMNELDQLPGGDLSSFPPMTARTLDKVRGALRDMGTAEAPTSRGAAGGYRGRVEQMDTGLDAVPGLREARQHYRAQSQGIEAAEGGASVMGPRSEFEPEIAGIANNPFGMAGARIRERQALRDKFGTRDQVKAVLDDIASAPDVRPNLRQLYGEEGDRFANAAGNLSAKQEQANFIAPNTNSQTFSRGQDDEGMFGAVRTAMEMFGGSIRPIIERLGRGLTITERERSLLVQLGIGSPEDAMRALAATSPAGANLAGNLFRNVGVSSVQPAANQGTATR